MAKRKYTLVSKGDVIRTEPIPGFYGIAVVLDDGYKYEIEPGKYSYPMCHIAETPVIYREKVEISDINFDELKPFSYPVYSVNGHFYRNDFTIHIWTCRNFSEYPVIGKIDPLIVYNGELSWDCQEDRFHLCGDIKNGLGRSVGNLLSENIPIYLNYISKTIGIKDDELNDIDNLLNANKFRIAFEKLCCFVKENNYSLTKELYEKIDLIGNLMGENKEIWENLRIQ